MTRVSSEYSIEKFDFWNCLVGMSLPASALAAPSANIVSGGVCVTDHHLWCRARPYRAASAHLSLYKVQWHHGLSSHRGYLSWNEITKKSSAHGETITCECAHYNVTVMSGCTTIGPMWWNHLYFMLYINMAEPMILATYNKVSTTMLILRCEFSYRASSRPTANILLLLMADHV